MLKGNKENTIVALIVFIVSVLIFGNTLSFSFVNWDDPLHITDNILVKDFSVKDFFQNYEAYYLYTWLTHMIWGIVYKLSDGNPMFFHLLNVVFHAVNSIFIYYLGKFIFKEKRIPFIIAILFIVHPVHVEAVAWSSAFKDVIFSFFYLAGILVYINYLNKHKLWKIVLLCVLYFLATSSKIQALHFPVVLVLIELFKNRRLAFKHIFLFLALMFFGFRNFQVALILSSLCFLIFIFTYYKNISFKTLRVLHGKLLIYLKQKRAFLIWIYRGFVIGGFIWVLFFIGEKLILVINGFNLDADQVLYHFNFLERLLMSGYALFYYVTSFLFPFNNIAVNPYPNFNLPDVLNSFFPYLLIYVALITVVVIIWRGKYFSIAKKNQLLFGLLFFLTNVSFVLHFMPIHGRVIVADRYAYLAIFGLFLCLFVILDKVFRRNKFYLVIISVGLFVLYAYQSKTYSSVWNYSLSLYDDVIKKNPDIAFPYNNKALFYYYEGNYNDALINYELAISKDSTFTNAYYNRGLLLLDKGEYNQALSDFTLAIKYSRITDPEILTSRGWVYYLLGNYDSAVKDYNLAIEADTSYSIAYNNRALCHFEMNNLENAFQDVNMAIDLNGEMHEAYNNRGWFKLNSNDVVGALHDFEQSYQLNSQFFNAVMNLAWAHFILESYEGAAHYYKEAYDLNPKNVQVVYYLALSEYHCGRINKACYYFQIASEMGHQEAFKMKMDICADL